MGITDGANPAEPPSGLGVSSRYRQSLPLRCRRGPSRVLIHGPAGVEQGRDRRWNPDQMYPARQECAASPRPRRPHPGHPDPVGNPGTFFGGVHWWEDAGGCSPCAAPHLSPVILKLGLTALLLLRGFPELAL